MRRLPPILALLLLLPVADAGADQRCEQCHYKTRICQALGTRGSWGWKSTVKRMQKLGAKITDEEAKLLATCLAAAPKGAPHVCKDNDARGNQ